MKKVLLISFVFIFFGASDLFAQRFVYTPNNPAFGGNTFNYQWMLNSAQAQNSLEDPNSPLNAFDRDPVSDFQESLNRQILSRLSREIVNRQFGEEGLGEGSFTLGDYQIDIGNSSSGLNITIVDVVTGATTVVQVPFF